ncbi:hypothetical protein [Sphingobium sp.]|uniref:hypothetical protein n=1 Tax=Sphingobium sp. TaxID=1912891 RepID=UPI002624F388|nr:hypothetical protein [Sphingobium sp.]
MTFGAIINHPDGARQFDTEHPALCLRAKGQLNQSVAYQQVPPGMVGGYWFAKVSYTGIAPVIAIRPTDCSPALVNTSRNGDNFEFIFRLFRNPAGWKLDWWIFDLPAAPTNLPATGHALVFWDAEGNVTFDSRYPPMKMPKSIVAGKTYAIALSTGAAYRETVEMEVDTFGNPIAVWTTQVGGIERTGESFDFVLRDTFDHFYSTYDVEHAPNWFIVDVTNL